MNNFRIFLDNDLRPLIQEEKKDRKERISFKVSINLKYYEKQNEKDPELVKEYAKRDKKGVSSRTKSFLRKNLGKLAGDTQIVASFQAIRKDVVVYEITVTGKDIIKKIGELIKKASKHGMFIL